MTFLRVLICYVHQVGHVCWLVGLIVSGTAPKLLDGFQGNLVETWGNWPWKNPLNGVNLDKGAHLGISI